MLKLTKTGIGLLTRQYRSVLKKCLLINLGVFAINVLSSQPAIGNILIDDGGWVTESSGDYTIAIGINSIARKNRSVAIGADAYVDANSSVALGRNSQAYEDGVISVGNRDVKRKIINVAAGTDDTDAVNYSQIKNFITASALSGYATKATTLSGYGITDAYTKTQVDNLISQAGGSSVDLSDYYTKSEVYNKTEIDDIQSLNNYYRKDKKSGILNGFEEGKIGNEIGDNFSKFRADNDSFLTNNDNFALNNDNFASNNDSFLTNNDNFVAKNDDFATNNLSRLGAFSKCEKACPRPSERFPASLEKNSAFEQYSRSARGTFLFVSPTHKNVLDSFSQLTANDNFHLVNDGIFSNQSTTFDAKVAENVPAAELRFNIANETGKEFAKMPFCAPTVAGTSIFFQQKNIEVLDNFSQNIWFNKTGFKVVANDNFATTTFLRAI